MKEATGLPRKNLLPDDKTSIGSGSPFDDETETQRRVQRGDESKGDPDERDEAGDYADSSESTSDPARDQGLVRRDIPS